MRRGKVAVAAGCCLSFFLGTLLNVFFIPGFEPHQQQPPPPRRGVPPAFAGSPLYWPGADRESQRSELARQIRERYQELLRYQKRQAPAAAARRLVRPLERRLMDLAQPRTSSEQTLRLEKGKAPQADSRGGPYPEAKVDLALSPPLLGCRDIHNVTSLHYLGSGYTKAVYKVVLNRTLAVALKSVDFGGHDIENCVKQYAALDACYRLASYKIVKEMILLQRLQHANILQIFSSYAENDLEIISHLHKMETKLLSCIIYATSNNNKLPCLHMCRH